MTEFNAVKNLDSFGRALGNDINLLAIVVEAVQSVKNNDATQIGKMLTTAKKRGDESAVKGIRFIIGKVWDGVKVVYPDKGEVIVKIKDATYSFDAIDMIVKAAKDKLSLRGPGVANRFKKAAADAEAAKAPAPLQITHSDIPIPTVTEPAAGPAAEPEADAGPTDWNQFLLDLTVAERENLRTAFATLDAVEVAYEIAA
jgi:hypothetical protein